MPFVSERQKRYLYANRPDIARTFQRETAPGTPLPDKVSGAGGARDHGSMLNEKMASKTPLKEKNRRSYWLDVKAKKED